MDAAALSSELAEPIGSLGAAFYFSPAAAARAESIGIGLGALYALGRGGVAELVEELCNRAVQAAALLRAAAMTSAETASRRRV